MKAIKKLADSEMEIMKKIWAADSPVSINYIISVFDEKKWKKQTVNTFLARLIDKGVLFSQKVKKTNYYSPAVTEQEYQQFEAQNLLNSIYNGSLNSFLSALWGENVDRKNIEELKKWFDKVSEDD